MVSVVVPLYNEEDNIADLQAELAAALSGIDHEIVFVDDGSKDRTLERIRRGPGIRILTFSKNTGQSAAMYEGIHAARGEVIVLLDGDLQNDPTDIPRLLAEIEKEPISSAATARNAGTTSPRKSPAASPIPSAAASPRTACATPAAR